MSLVLEVSRKVNINDRDAQSVLTRALRMGFTVRVCNGNARGGDGGAGFLALAKMAGGNGASVGVASRTARKKKKTRGIYRIDEQMGKKMSNMRNDGLTIRAIAKAFRLSTSGVGNYLKRVQRGEVLAS